MKRRCLQPAKSPRAITMAEIEEATIKGRRRHGEKEPYHERQGKELTAYHEAGHAVATYYCDSQDPVHQISIIPAA